MKNQANALAVLSVGEIEQVSGAGAFLGDATINGVYATNSLLSSPLFSSIGSAASAIDLNRTHELVDLLAFQVSSVAATTVDKILGGTDSHNVPLHCNKESGEGLYSWLQPVERAIRCSGTESFLVNALMEPMI